VSIDSNPVGLNAICLYLVSYYYCICYHLLPSYVFGTVFYVVGICYRVMDVYVFGTVLLCSICYHLLLSHECLCIYLNSVFKIKIIQIYFITYNNPLSLFHSTRYKCLL
jgi:hypothetical protein